jgi:hypothetical protein
VSSISDAVLGIRLGFLSILDGLECFVELLLSERGPATMRRSSGRQVANEQAVMPKPGSIADHIARIILSSVYHSLVSDSLGRSARDSYRRSRCSLHKELEPI